MHAADAHRVEAAVGYVAVGSLATAVGFAAFHAAGRFTDLAGAVAATVASGLFACPAAIFLLRRLEGQAKPFPQPYFDTVDFEPVVPPVPEELVLTDADRVEPEGKDETLILEDVLAEMSPDSRVVQLFDRRAMATPGQLRDRIDRRLVGGTAAPDASEALFAALAELRRSLR